MKRAFVRALWGVHDKSHRVLRRLYRVDQNILALRKNKFNEPFITYVFGEENFKNLKDLGFENLILLNKEPHSYDPLKFQYRHKLEILRYAMEEDGYDEIVHMDWDCYPIKKLPVEFWDILGKKEKFQACLMQYHRPKCLWRKTDQRKLPNGGFVYIRDKAVPSELIKVWEQTDKKFLISAEPAMGKYTDNLIGGWQGIDKYWDLFEPDVCNLKRCSVYPQEKKDTKNTCFIHYQGGRS